MLARKMVAVAVFLVSVGSVAQGQGAKDFRGFLASFEYTNTKSLAKAFKLADENPGALITALDDPNGAVQLNAQRLIRYVADPKAMAALRASKSGQEYFTGAVPVPLKDWDYEQIQKMLLCESCSLKSPQVDYLYALVLDGSQKSLQVLGRISARYSPNLIYGPPPGLLSSAAELEKQLVETAFFLSEETKKAAIAKRIAINRKGNKALWVIYSNRGPLVAEWYHVVVVREPKGWRIISVSFAGNS